MTLPKWADMDSLFLVEGPAGPDGVRIPIAPTMATITYKGERFFRMPATRREHGRPKRWAGMYLWVGWATSRMVP